MPELPPEVIEVLTSAEHADRVAAAMRQFIEVGDADAFAQAVALYVRAAALRREPIERVLGVLNAVAQTAEPSDPTRSSAESSDPSPLHRALLYGVLVAFYGEATVADEARGQRDRQAAARRGEDFASTEDFPRGPLTDAEKRARGEYER
jgi:hypothetical protein